MKRREFIALLGGTMLPWSAAVQGRPERPVVGFLCSGTPETDAFRVAAAVGGLKESGYVDGANAAFELRWAQDQYERLPSLTTELVRQEASVIVAFGNASAIAAKSAVLNVPIVFSVGDDPIKMGLVESFRRPEGNGTGVSFLTNSVVTKQLEVIQEAVPHASSVGFLISPDNPNAEKNKKELLAATQALGTKLLVVQARATNDLKTAFSELSQQGVEALIVEGDNFFTNRGAHIVELASQQKIPTIYPLREFTAAGGLISYGTRE